MTNSEKTPKEYRRVRRYSLAPEFFLKMLKEGAGFSVVEGLPKGSVFRGFAHDYSRNCISIFVEHPDFEKVEFGGVPGTGSIQVKFLEEGAG